MCHDPYCQFWMNWAAQALVALGTIGAVVVALFGGWIRGRRILLLAHIEQRHGTAVPIVIASSEPEVFPDKEIPTRFYQLRISNRSRLFAAHGAYVWLTRIENLDQPDAIWSGEIPMRWQHCDLMPGSRTIGEPANVDIFAISDTDNAAILRLQPNIVPTNLPLHHVSSVRLRLTVELRCVERAPQRLRLRVDWTGRWAPSDAEMQHNMIFDISR